MPRGWCFHPARELVLWHTGENHFLESKKPICLRPRKWRLLIEGLYSSPVSHCWRDTFSVFAFAPLSFVLVSWCVVCFWTPPLRPPRLLTRQLCGSGCVCRPEFSIIRLKNNSIYLKPDESFVYIGGRVSIPWLQQIPWEGWRCETSVLPQFCAIFAVFSCGVLPESGGVGTPAETPFTMGKGWKSSNFVTPDDSARIRKMRKMMSLNCSICLMPIFGVGKAYRIWTPKGGPPQFSTWMFVSSFLPFVVFMVSGELLKQLGAFRASCRNPKNRIATRSNAWIWRARFWSRLLLK